jgi:hypothetical protein
MELQKNETYLKGNWVFESGVVKADEVTKRIEWLLAHSLNKIKNDWSGWETLYQDVNDARYCEHTYEQSQMHGGGPPSLIFLTVKDATIKHELV